MVGSADSISADESDGVFRQRLIARGYMMENIGISLYRTPLDGIAIWRMKFANDPPSSQVEKY